MKAFLLLLVSFTHLLSSGTLYAADPTPPTPQAPPAPPPTTVVTKVAEDFSGAPWINSQWNNVGAKITSDKDIPSDSKSANSLRVEVNFSGTGEFQHHEVTPPKPLYFPGQTQKITMHFKTDGRFGPLIAFMDGWGRSKADDGQDMNWGPKFSDHPNQWTTATFDVPANWVQPIAIRSLTTHNYDFKNDKVNMTYWIGDVVVQTDLAQVDMKTGDLKTWKPEPHPANPDDALKKVPATPLITISFSTGVEGNVFSNTTPAVSLRIGNLKPGVLTGSGVFSVTDEAGKPLMNWKEAISVDSATAFHHEIPAPRYGLYNLTASLSLSDGTKFNSTNVLARVPDQKELTPEQKLTSRYGIDDHSAANTVHLYSAFKKAGIYWFRDYAFQLEWMLRAKGPDRRYAAWPGYTSIMADYEANGLLVLPILHAIDPPNGSKIGPSEQWTRDIADIILSFPTITAWEVDNEYDINNGTAEKPLGENYLLFHKKFGELVSLLGSGKLLAVENGRAGMYPKEEERFVKSGSFANIDVINFHHYAGTDAPETNIDEYNSGDHTDEDVTGNFFDKMRGLKHAALADGKKRQAWLSEFGWDTKAGPIVSREEEAAYLQRGFLLAFAAGIDRAFWYWNFDSPKAEGIFDGCGLFTFDYQPKLSYAAMAGLTSILPRPDYVGRINIGPNTWGYVFENDGKLVAGLWALQGTGPTATFHAEQLSDYLGNKMEGMSAKLGIAPVYAIGLSKGDPLYLQTAYEISTPLISQCLPTESSEAVITVANNRAEPIQATVKATLPAGWTTPQAESAVTVAPGETKDIHFPFTVGPQEKIGVQTLSFLCQEGKTPIKTITSSVVVPRSFTFSVASLTGAPGKTSVPVEIFNRTASPLSGQLTIKVPQAWQTPSPTVPVADIPPGKSKTTPVEVTWSPNWKPDETATISFQSSKGSTAEKPIIPNQYHLRKAGKITVDGNLADWSKENQLPEWMLGSSSGPANAKVWLAWAPEGIYGAVDVHDSRANVTDPKTFWGDDCLELFLSTHQPSPQASPGDHHFWIVPLINEKRAYLGQWKIKNEIDANRYDVQGMQSVAKQTADGYIMEFFLPSALLQNYSPQEGGNLGLNVNLAVHGHHDNRAVYWPQSKAGGVIEDPSTWGRVTLNP